MKNLPILTLLLTGSLVAQDPGAPPSAPVESKPGFVEASATFKDQLERSLAELAALREQIAGEQIPLSRQLADLESELSAVRAESQQKSRLLDSRALDVTTITGEIKAREEESGYVSSLLSQYTREFETRLHISELHRYEADLEAAKLAAGNDGLSEREVFEAQAALLDRSIDRLVDALGGTMFEGTAVDPDGEIDKGKFVLVGPSALFLSDDGRDVGTAEQRLGSLEPAVIPFTLPTHSTAATDLLSTGEGYFPLDPTQGNAHKFAAIDDETLFEHVQKGGAVMVPIFALAALALLVALYKWVSFLLIANPSKRRVRSLLNSVSEGDQEEAAYNVRAIKGPVGRMLEAGVAHLGQPRELIEEVMFEKVLTTKLRLNSMLPFIAVCAASAPLLGLLGTVTGIIDTFKLITVFGSGDVKSLSGGISEALITTKFGLIVAIPSLLIHAYLSRRARGMLSDMEAAAVTFVNHLSKAPQLTAAPAVPARGEGGAPSAVASPDPNLVRTQVHEIVRELLEPLARDESNNSQSTQAS